WYERPESTLVELFTRLAGQEYVQKVIQRVAGVAQVRFGIGSCQAEFHPDAGTGFPRWQAFTLSGRFAQDQHAGTKRRPLNGTPCPKVLPSHLVNHPLSFDSLPASAFAAARLLMPSSISSLALATFAALS